MQQFGNLKPQDLQIDMVILKDIFKFQFLTWYNVLQIL